REPVAVVYLCAAVLLSRKDEVLWLEQQDEEGMTHSLLSSLPDITDAEDASTKDDKTYLSLEPVPVEEAPSAATYPLQTVDEDVAAAAAIPLPPSRPSSPTDPSRSSAPRNRTPQGPPRPTIPLSSLLEDADALYARYPPSHPGLHLSSIMGPQSVVFTWDARIPDDDAEKMVLRPDLVVYPEVDTADEAAADEKRGTARKRRKLHKRFRVRDRRMVMAAGAVLVLGVAIAVYGPKQGGRGGLLDMLKDEESRRHWMQLGGWVGGAVGSMGRLWGWG
ncbi:hypothetical protein HDZ31DRAFT_22592, partial [Schizophyllum fasciatum]